MLERLLPPIELVRLKPINFHPMRPEPLSRLGELREICIATKSRALGDALALTTLPGKLRARYPQLKITTYPRGFNPVVFYGNPNVSGVSYLPDAVWGDDCNEGRGQLIQLKEQYFGLSPSDLPRPEIHLLAHEKHWAERMIAEHTFPENRSKPLVVLHPWGKTNSELAPVEYWDALVARWKSRVRFWQVGIYKQGAVQGCEYYFFQEPGRWNARKLFALMGHARGFVGVDSGPMHVARAFDVPSFVHTRQPMEDLRKDLWNHPVNHLRNTLYTENGHGNPDTCSQLLDAFLNALH